MTDLRTIEHESIRAFIEQAGKDGYLKGRVLDYGCGKQPYRSLVESFGAEYHFYDHESFPAHVGDISVGTDPTYTERFDAVVCNQIIQYIPLWRDERYTPDGSLRVILWRLRDALSRGDYGVYPKGHLVLTYPTNWPEVEQEDLHRFTKAGMERLLAEVGFTIVRHERRASVFGGVFKNSPPSDTEEFALGYGVIARA